MQATLDKQDYQAIAAKVLELIKQEYDLVPKKPQKYLIGLEEFRHRYGHDKSPAWLKLYLLPKMTGCVFGLNCGRGHPVQISEAKAAEWMDKYEDTIDWTKPLP